MGWKWQSVIPTIKLGPAGEAGSVQQVEGKFVGIRETNRFEGELCFEILRDDGSTVFVKGNASLVNQLHNEDVGKRVKLEFESFYDTGYSSKGRNIRVGFWEPDVVKLPQGPSGGESDSDARTIPGHER